MMPPASHGAGGAKSQTLRGVVFRRVGDTVFVGGGYSENISSDPWGELGIGTLDEDMRPSSGVSIPVCTQGAPNSCVLEVQARGYARFRLLGHDGHNGWVFLSGSYSTK